MLNGANPIVPAEDKYVAMPGLAEGSLAIEGFADWLRGGVVVAGNGRVQEPAAKYAGATRQRSRLFDRHLFP